MAYIKNSCLIGLINTVKHANLPQVAQAAVNSLEELTLMYLEPQKYGLSSKTKPTAKFDNAFKEIFEAVSVPSQNIETTLKVIDRIIIYLYEQDYTNDKVYIEKRISIAEYYVRILKDFIVQEQKTRPALAEAALNVLGKALIYLAKEPYSELAKSAVELSLNFLSAIPLGSEEESSLTDSAYEISKLVRAARLSTTKDALGGGYGFPQIARDLVNAAKRGDKDLNEAIQQAVDHFEGDQSVGVTYGADDIIRTIHEMTDNDTDRQLGQKIIARFTVAYVKPNFSNLTQPKEEVSLEETTFRAQIQPYIKIFLENTTIQPLGRNIVWHFNISDKNKHGEGSVKVTLINPLNSDDTIDVYIYNRYDEISGLYLYTVDEMPYEVDNPIRFTGLVREFLEQDPQVKQWVNAVQSHPEFKLVLMRMADGADFGSDITGDTVTLQPDINIRAMADATLAQAKKDVKAAQAATKAVAKGKIDTGGADDEPHLFVGSTGGEFEPFHSAVLRAQEVYEKGGKTKEAAQEASDILIAYLIKMRNMEYPVNIDYAIFILNSANNPDLKPIVNALKKFKAGPEQDASVLLAELKAAINANPQLAALAVNSAAPAEETAPVISVSRLLAELAPDSEYVSALTAATVGAKDRNIELFISRSVLAGLIDESQVRELVQVMQGEDGFGNLEVNIVDISENEIQDVNLSTVYLISKEDIDKFNPYSPTQSRVIAVNSLTDASQRAVLYRAIFACIGLRSLNPEDITHSNSKVKAVIELYNLLDPSPNKLDFDTLRELINEPKNIAYLRKLLKGIVANLPTPTAITSEEIKQIFQAIKEAVKNI